jgi:vitamin B12/bleomycin/antimicrobial peptide transport system ATP-binding/permease protein
MRALREAWALAAPYWRSEERLRAWALLAAVVGLNLALVGMSVVLSFWNREFFNALQARDADAFWALLFLGRMTDSGPMPGFVMVAALYILVAVYQLYLRQALQIRWRAWVTERQLAAWLAHRAYYRIALTDPGTDNPDQRIAEDIRIFVDESLALSLGLMRAVVTLFSFVFVLWSLSGPLEVLGVSIPGYMVWVALLYALAGTWLAHLIGRPLTRINFRQQQVEADFRYALVRFRENTEGIALSGGERDEQAGLLRRFHALMANWWALMVATKRLTFYTSAYGQAAVVFPIVVASPGYFAGRTQLGDLTQTAGAFGSVQESLSWFVDNYARLTEWRATVTRLTGFTEAVAAAAAAADSGVLAVRGEAPGLALEGVRLALPGGRVLLDGADLAIAPGERVLVMGASGSGKSTLFRAMAGIWPFGQGRVVLPREGRVLFLPQRPYIPLGTLRDALCYPQAATGLPDAAVREALHAVGLGALEPRLDEADAWSQRLSGGEQQRLAVARALLNAPEWLFLDEATASLDTAAEAALMGLLTQRLPNTAIISIAHRESLRAFHTRRVVVSDGRLAEAAA